MWFNNHWQVILKKKLKYVRDASFVFPGTQCSWGLGAGQRESRWQEHLREKSSAFIWSALNMVGGHSQCLATTLNKIIFVLHKHLHVDWSVLSGNILEQLIIVDCVVGLDVQQEYSAYYSGAKRFGDESCIRKSPTWKVQRILDTGKRQGPTSTIPTSSDRGQTSWQQQFNQTSDIYNIFELDFVTSENQLPCLYLALASISQAGRWDASKILHCCNMHLKDIFFDDLWSDFRSPLRWMLILDINGLINLLKLNELYKCLTLSKIIFNLM